MQGNNVNGQNQIGTNMQQQVGGVPNTNNFNNIGTMPANNGQVNMNNNMVNPNVPNNQMNSNMAFNQGGYVEPPKKKSSTMTFIIIFLILAGAAVGGYFAGTYIYNITHQSAE